MPRKKAATVYAASASRAHERCHTAQKSLSQLPVPAAEPHDDPVLDHDLDAQSEVEDLSEDEIEELAGLDLTNHEHEKFDAHLKLQDSNEAEKFRNHFGIVRKQPKLLFPVVQMPEAPLHLRELAKQLAAQQVGSSDYNFAHRKPRISSTSATITLPNPVTSFAAHHLPLSSETVSMVKQTLIGHHAPPPDNSAPGSSDLKELVFDGNLSDLDFSDSESENEDANYAPIQLPNSSSMLLHPGLKRPTSALPSNPSTPLTKWKLNPDQLPSAFKDITHHLKSAKTQLHVGPEGLEARKTCAIQSTLHSIIENDSSLMHASCVAAKAAMFATDWDSWLVRHWIHDWIDT
ncbi:hypothetical protein GYMLUDRAFT_252911 [Collybiopsis luxurians FD-317 M1]|uniref:Uncharacterized protein n=1 Tax=Collybiopsis luxurians FD-317 M1 TaxID=944289 RepID=A0A0D0AK36_9AGAR|nr:hypothetical protein GYMLUDRAFT_252911 [Collybiopsis luxurians FD-317 M1]